MTQQQLDLRKQRAQREVFVITPTEDGWSVRSANNPSNHYLVSSSEAGITCTCPDFQGNAEDPAWKCKHVFAVEDYQAKIAEPEPAPASYEEQEREAIQQEEPAPQPEAKPRAQMLVKRSLSPDGRIDSISLEFSFELADEPAGEIKAKALAALQLQTDIVQKFVGSVPVKGNGRGNGAATPGNGRAEGNGAVAARIIDVGVSNGPYGERYFLNVDVSGRRAKLFGTASQIVQAVAAVGKRLSLNALQPGLVVNTPCRAITQPSRDGRYLNVTEVLPPVRGGYQ